MKKTDELNLFESTCVEDMRITRVPNGFIYTVYGPLVEGGGGASCCFVPDQKEIIVQEKKKVDSLMDVIILSVRRWLNV